MASNNEVILRGRDCCVIPEDILASAEIKPGEMVEIITAATNRGRLQVAGANSRTVLIADRKLRGSIDDNYSAGEPVRLVALAPGVEFRGFITQNSAQQAGARLATAASGSHSTSSTNANIVAELTETHAASASETRRNMRRL